MRFTPLIICIFAVVMATLVHAGSVEDKIKKALEKFCGGIAISSPKKGQTFTNPKKIKVTVTRKPNAQAKVINAVDAYSIDSKGKVKYLATIWKGNYNLNKKASLTVNLSKVKNLKFPGQFEIRVWVHNKSGPDCTYMSKVFKVKSSSHNNELAEQEYESLSEDVDRGCFGVEIVTPTAGSRINSDELINIQIHRDSAAHADELKSLVLYKIDLETRQSEKVQVSWTGEQAIQNVLNIKDTIPASAAADNTAFYYQLVGGTQHGETCEFYSHPFYVDI
ncbi:hypothetical protein BDB01DRAFT_778617 [Pilobolus umbonatus]|nr:hypothetical protein BDB01DRAFT_778617 [Pilobolus umbonatus]